VGCEDADFPAVSIIAPYDSISGHPGYAMKPVSMNWWPA
jgi:hypothetical protein